MPEGCYSSPWLSINMLSIDENTIMIEEKETSLITMLENEYGFNVLSNFLVPKYIKKISNFLWKKSDVKVIDNMLINGSANIVSSLSSKIRLLQTGYIYHYAFTMIIGLLFFLIIFYDF